MTENSCNSDHKELYGAISRATVVIMVWIFLDKILALAKEMLLAHEFGIEAGLDVFNLAFASPGLLILLIDVAICSAFIPLHSEWKQKYSPEEVRNRTMTVFVFCLGGILTLALLGYLVSPWYFPAIAYGMTDFQHQVGVVMEQHLMLMVVLEGTSVLFGALMQVWKLFALVTFAQSCINISLILFLIFGESLGIDLLVWGTLAGCAAKMLWLFYWVSRRGFHIWKPFKFATVQLMPFIRLVGPLMGSALIMNSILLVDQSMATQVSTGGVSSLRYAYRINDLPLQLLVLAISRAIFPYISESAAKGDSDAMQYVFIRSLIFIGLISFPMTAFVVIYAPDIVSVLLQRGAFGPEAAMRTTLTLQCYVIGLYLFAYGYINGAFFSALKLVRALFFMGLLSLALNVGLNKLFIWAYGEVYAIALSSSLAALIVCLIFVIILHGKLSFKFTSSEIKSMLLPIFVTVVMGATFYPLRGTLSGLGVPKLITLGVWALLYFSSYAGLIYLFRTPECEEVLAFVNVQKMLGKVKRVFGK